MPLQTKPRHTTLASQIVNGCNCVVTNGKTTRLELMQFRVLRYDRLDRGAAGRGVPGIVVCDWFQFFFRSFQQKLAWHSQLLLQKSCAGQTEESIDARGYILEAVSF